ncbi:MAG: arabinose operon transcriptional regulator AraC [Nevskia sp.]|nr:arabinose operon transcriptional regulator AraC [Nevskia sp.]
MDDLTDLQPERALAGFYYSLISDLAIGRHQHSAVVEAWNKLTVSPWTASPHAHTHSDAYLQVFRDTFQHTDRFLRLCQDWRSRFDDQGTPLPQVDVRRFLTDAIQIQLHSPHTHHDFFYIHPTFRPNSVMDFSIHHPYAADFWTLYVTEAGSGFIRTGEAPTRTLRPGSVVLVPPACDGEAGRQPDAAEWRCHCLGFRAKPQWFDLFAWIFSLQRPVILAPAAGAELELIRSDLNQISTISYRRGDINEALCFNIIENLLIRLYRLNRHHGAHGANPSTVEPSDPRIGAAVDLMLRHYNKALNVKDIADQARLSPSRLGTLFKQQYGVSLIQWRDAIRLDKAKELLANTDLSIASISGHVGWDDQLYFSRRFKNRYGDSPRSYRKRLNGDLITTI